METNNIYDIARKVTTKKDFQKFMKSLLNNLTSNSNEWENDTLESFLNGFNGYFLDKDNLEEIDWNKLAEILLAARVYE